MANPDTEAWARNIVRKCMIDKGMVGPSGEPPLGAMQVVQSIGRLESSYGKATKPPEWVGSNNWGAVTCCMSKADGSCPPNTFPAQDSYGKDGKIVKYVACFKKYATPEEGCADMLRIMTKTEAERLAVMAGDTYATSAAMYDAGYYKTNQQTREAAIAEHTKTMDNHIAQMAAALKEPISTRGHEPPPPEPEETTEDNSSVASALLFAMLPFGSIVIKAIKGIGKRR